VTNKRDGVSAGNLGMGGNLTVVTVRLSLNFILGVKIDTVNREDRVSGEMSVTILHSS
jgi:hypothetical protein